MRALAAAAVLVTLAVPVRAGPVRTPAAGALQSVASAVAARVRESGERDGRAVVFVQAGSAELARGLQTLLIRELLAR
ncbi:MAG: hypothetical protein ACK4N5_27590, partial [Myxococcales bacterium]